MSRMAIWKKVGGFFNQRGSAHITPAETTGAGPQRVSDASIVLLADVLQHCGSEPLIDGRILSLASGITLEVELEEAVRLSANAVRTSTRIIARHADAFPLGLTEYQHARGNSTVESISSGFESWAAMDLVALQDALLDAPQTSSILRKSYGDLSAGRSLEREFILGPTVHVATLPPSEGADEHPFCPCCLLMNSFEAFDGLLQEDRVLGIRLYAAVHPDGEAVSDCRVNGEEFSDGARALLRYASMWPRRGFEYRKQYVVIRTKPIMPTGAQLNL